MQLLPSMARPSFARIPSHARFARVCSAVRAARCRRALVILRQVTGTLGGFGLNWPESLGKFLSYAGILDFDVDVTSPQCILDWRWVDDLRLQMALPIACAVVNFAQYGLATLLLNSRLKHVKALRMLLGAPEDAEDLPEMRRGAISRVVTFINIVYLTLTRYSVACFVCISLDDDPDAPTVLKATPSVECFNNWEHIGIVIIGALGLIVYTIGNAPTCRSAPCQPFGRCCCRLASSVRIISKRAAHLFGGGPSDDVPLRWFPWRRRTFMTVSRRCSGI